MHACDPINSGEVVTVRGGMASGLEQPSQRLLGKLDELLAESTTLLEDCAVIEHGHGLDYAVRLDEARKVNHDNNSRCGWLPPSYIDR